MFILVASYFFYSCWDWRFLFLLVFSTLLDYFSGLKISKETSSGKRRLWLYISVGINLGLLLFFKYFNFFIDSFQSMLSVVGVQANVHTLNIILPVGISFYTFHGLSYVFDIYNKKIEPTKRFTDYAVFVAYFPLLVAGPIERARHLLPEFKVARVFNYQLAVVGMRLVLWGLFKKVVIADNCAGYVDDIFANYHTLPSLTLFWGVLLFTVQIYADFSGYTDIATGISKMLGFDILKNFNFPYFSKNIGEFWKRWHISLTSWFRDYLYIPLGGNRRGLFIQIRNVFIIFLVSGFWHGANLTFIFWGLLHALFFLPLIFKGDKNVEETAKSGSKTRVLASIIATNLLVMLGWIFFRSLTIEDAFQFIFAMGKNTTITNGDGFPMIFSFLTLGIISLFTIEWFNRHREFGLSFLGNTFKLNSAAFRMCVYLFISVLVVLNLPNTAKSFIYFQF